MTKYWCYICQKQFNSQTQIPKECPICKQEAFQQITSSVNPQTFQAYQPVPPSPPTVPVTNNNNPFSSFINSLSQQTNLILGNNQNNNNNGQNIISSISSIAMSFDNNNQGASQQQMPIPQIHHININNPNLIGPQGQQNGQMGPNFATNILTNLPQILNFSVQVSQYLFQNLINSGQSFRPAKPQQINALQKINNPHDCAICQGQAQQQSQPSDQNNQNVNQTLFNGNSPNNHNNQNNSNNNGNFNGYKLKCGHQFHMQCIKPWFQRANTCPTCRDTL